MAVGVFVAVHQPIIQSVSKSAPLTVSIISFLHAATSPSIHLQFNDSTFTLSLSEHALNYIASKFTHSHTHTENTFNMTSIDYSQMKPAP